jgi:NAD(P)-dependent dehydrogenase (short-subunit alcohol dehydrogenase family)
MPSVARTSAALARAIGRVDEPCGIRCNTVVPGRIDAPMGRDATCRRPNRGPLFPSAGKAAGGKWRMPRYSQYLASRLT